MSVPFKSAADTTKDTSVSKTPNLAIMIARLEAIEQRLIAVEKGIFGANFTAP
jgi:hypothetical protein